MPTRIEFDLKTGLRREIELTQAELNAAAAAKAAEDAANAARVPDPIEELRAAMKADPALLGKIKATK
jgi:hypothetical protein